MSKRTIDVHWGEHHRNFVEELNKQLEKDDILYGYTMDELVKATYNNGNPLPEFNNAAEVHIKLVSSRFRLLYLSGILKLLAYLHNIKLMALLCSNFNRKSSCHRFSLLLKHAVVWLYALMNYFSRGQCREFFVDNKQCEPFTVNVKKF